MGLTRRQLGMGGVAALAALGGGAWVRRRLGDGGWAKLWHRQFQHGLTLRPVLQGLAVPWSLAPWPDGRWLVSERPGRLRLADPATGHLGAPLLGLPPVLAVGEGGLLGVVADPAAADNQRLYWCFAQSDGERAGTSVASGRLDGERLADVEIVFRQKPVLGSPLHFGGRLCWSPDGHHLFISLGDRWQRDRAQDPGSGLGQVVRLDVASGRSEVWSHGHRNVQGLAFRPGTDELWASEHGPQGGDEINLLRQGGNHGWPLVTDGCEYVSCVPIGQRVSRAGLVDPAHRFGAVSVPPSALLFVTSARYPAWQGKLLVGALLGRELSVLTLSGDRVVAEQPLWLGRWRRVRDLLQDAEGWIHAAVEGPEGAVLRLEP